MIQVICCSSFKHCQPPGAGASSRDFTITLVSSAPANMDKWVPYGQNQGIMPKLDPCGSHIGILAHVGPTWGPYRS